MRMQFGADDEAAFHTRRDELGEQFADWLNAKRLPGDPDDAGLMLDWKVGYSDGKLGTWTLADVQEFLFSWCPRKLSANPEDCDDIPLSVAAFVEFLADSDLLGRGSDRPTEVRRYCVERTAEFVKEMGNPANFGMAKSLFASAGAFEPGADLSPEGLTALIGRMQGLPPDSVDDALDHLVAVHERPTVGPVRLPDAQERLAGLRAAPAPTQLRLLADYCAPPGRQLTGTGNLRLADARHLVEALDTDDDLGIRGLRSATDLPTLTWLLDVAVEAGVVRRQKGRLVAVARFAALDEVTAYETVVRAAVTTGLSGPRDESYAAVTTLQEVVDECVVGLLAELLDEGHGGIEVEALVELMNTYVVASFGPTPFTMGFVPSWVWLQLERLAALGVVTLSDSAEECPGCGEHHELDGRAALTAAGTGIAVELVRGADVEVLLRGDPATADAAAIVDLVGTIDDKEWAVDAAAWFAAQPDPAAAAAALVTEITTEDREALVVLGGLGEIEDVVGEHAVAAVRPQLGGPHDGLVVNWLIGRDAIDPATLDPTRFVAGMVDILAVALDEAGPLELVECLGEVEQSQQLLDIVWRLDHPRLPDVLDAIGARHPVKRVAKAARKALVRYRSRVSSLGAERGRAGNGDRGLTR